MIDKVIPQRLNSDVDSRFRPSTDMIDALNIVFNESYKGNAAATGNTASNDFSGDSGVIKPTPSNKSIEDIFLFEDVSMPTPANSSFVRVIGSVSDELFNIIYFFAWSSNPNEMGIYAWDGDGILPGTPVPGSYVRVYTSPKFNFPSDGFVKADVVHIGQREDINITSSRIRNTIVYFTDNRNEPKKINVYDVMEANLNFYNDLDILDMITACPKTPLAPIEFEFNFDPERDASNFQNIPGLQFAYQYVYKGGVESALSTYSKLAVPTAYLAVGVVSGTTVLENRCVLTIPRGTREVQSINLLTRYGNRGLWRLVDEIVLENQESPLYDELGDITYNYYNDRILIPIPDERANMPFSNLPRVAQAQSVISDRLLYGNYVEGYPDVPVSGTVVPIYNDTPSSQGLSLDIEVTPIMNQLLARPSSGTADEQNIYNKLGTNRVAGYKIDFSSVPTDFLQSESIVSISFTVIPHANFHFYNQHRSYHGSNESGLFGGLYHSSDTLDNINNPAPYEGLNTELYQNGRKYFGNNAGVKFLDGNDNQSYNKWSYQGWSVSDDGTGLEGQVGGVIDVAYGTSAANPFIIEGKPLTFSVTIQTNYDTTNPRENIRDAIYHLLTGEVEMPNNGTEDFASEVSSTQNTYSYSIDLDLSNGQKILAQSGTDHRKQLIVGLIPVAENGVPSQAGEPVGYFIVDKADVTFGLKAFRYMEAYHDTLPQDANCYIGLNLLDISNVSTMTCVPYVPANNHFAARVSSDIVNIESGNLFIGAMPLNLINGNIEYWTVFGQNFMQNQDPSLLNVFIPEGESYNPTFQNNFGDVDFNDPRNMYFFGENEYESVVNEQQTNTLFYPSNVSHGDFGLSICPAGYKEGRGNFCLGFLVDASGSTGAPLNLINTSDDIHDYYSANEGLDSDLARANSVFSLVDGEGGPGYRVNKTGIGEQVSWGSICPYVLFLGDIHDRLIINLNELGYPGSFLLETNLNPASGGGTGIPAANILDLGQPDPLVNGWVSTGGFFQTFRNANIPSPFFALPFDALSLVAGFVSTLSYDYAVPNTVNTWIELLSVDAFSNGITGRNYPRSFKTNANHDFGIVYYDQRGRSGNVNYLGNTYVRGYSNQDRPTGQKGRVDVQINIDSNPPDWATHYQIVYSPNSTVGDFVQYTTGPAFLDNIAQTETNDDLQDEALIYVSLGYLQGVNNVSYAHAYGAVNKDGGKDLYSHQEGDKLRILFYTDNDGETIVYPNNYVFDVLDVVTLPENSNESILFTGNEEDAVSVGALMPPSQTGQFLVLRNNQNTTGFSYSDVLSSYQVGVTQQTGNAYTGESSQNYWNNRTVVEIFSPKRAQDFDQRFYYEVGEKYNVALDSNGNKVHAQSSILLRDGDVYWRRVPVNFSSYNETNNAFTPILSTDNQNPGNPAFKNLILETLAFTDVISGCDSLDWGKPKVVAAQDQALYRRSSITYSDKNNYASKINSFTTFNAGQLNFKDLPNEYGNINYILNDYDNAVVIQEDKVSSIPVNRNIIATAGGDQSLVASQEVLGTQKFYAGNYGADNNPEGVVRAGESIYFANKSRREVYKMTRSKGIQVISKANMRAYFNNIFNQALKEQQSNGGKVRVVSGYDPLRDEYIISIYNMQDFTNQEINYDPFTGVFDDVEIIDPIDDDDDGFDPGDPPGPEEPSEDDGRPTDDDGKPDDTDEDDGTEDEQDPEADVKRIGESIAESEEEADPRTNYLGLNASQSGFSSMASSTQNRRVVQGDSSSRATDTTLVIKKPKPSTFNFFKNVDGAINYLLVQNDLTVGEYHLLRAQINDNFSLNLTQDGPINNFDLIQLLQVFGTTTDPNESAFESAPFPDQGGIPVGPSSLEAILWLIDDGTMTVGQYFYLASYIKLAAKADANEDNQVSSADLLTFISVYGFGTAQAGTSYDLNDPAFNL